MPLPLIALAAIVASGVISSPAAESRPAPRPNIILMMADDLGWGDPGFNGNTVIKTPQLDAMARAGLRFDRFYSGAPVCSPTRGSVLTGRHPYRYGIWYGSITALDVQVGRLRDELRTLGVADDTLLWFASDNGSEGDTGTEGNYRGTAGPFRGRKRSLWEGGIRVPGLLEWPAKIKPGSSTAVACSTLDYFPTILDLLGVRLPVPPSPLDGVSLRSLFDGRMRERPAPIPFETLGGAGTRVSRGSPRLALVDNRYKLLTDMDGAPGGDLLFDLLDDRGETTNVATAHADVVRAIKAQLGAFRESCKRSLAGKDYAVAFTPDKDDIHPSEPGFARALRSAAAAEPASERPAPPENLRAAGRRAKR